MALSFLIKTPSIIEQLPFYSSFGIHCAYQKYSCYFVG